MKRREFLDDISKESLEQIIPCFLPKKKQYQRGSVILSYPDASNQPMHIGILETGAARLEVLDADGEMFQLEGFQQGDVFGEMFTLPLTNYEYIVTAEEDCRVIFLDYEHVITPCEHVCSHHTQMISNLFIMTAQKTQEMSFHLSVLNQRNTREKILCYLKYVRMMEDIAGDEEFRIPMTLSKLAEYLRVDRAAMTREIRGMKDEGMLESKNRRFRLLA
jgi:CRP-like cAMP-binding protein